LRTNLFGPLLQSAHGRYLLFFARHWILFNIYLFRIYGSKPRGGEIAGKRTTICPDSHSDIYNNRLLYDGCRTAHGVIFRVCPSLQRLGNSFCINHLIAQTPLPSGFIFIKEGKMFPTKLSVLQVQYETDSQNCPHCAHRLEARNTEETIIKNFSVVVCGVCGKTVKITKRKDRRKVE
jgi:hypothetical protein